jgi:hypothetical protein
MSQIIQFLGTWFGAFCLGLWIPGAIFYGDKYKALDFHKPWLDVIRDILATVLWPVPFIVDMIKKMKGAAAKKVTGSAAGGAVLLLLPTLAMAADDKFTILGKGAWLIPAILIGVLCYTIPHGYNVWKAGTFRFNDRPGETGKRKKIDINERTPLPQNISWLVSILLVIGLIIFFAVQYNAR